jgi:hypothetical protein
VDILNDDLVAFVSGPVSILAAGRDADLRPWLAHPVALRIGADRASLTVFLPDRPGATLLAVLAPGAPLAVTASHVPSLRSVQVKGLISTIRPATEKERPEIDKKAAGFTGDLAAIGFAPRVVRRLVTWPCTALEMRVEAVFEQSPGPGAGRPWGAA